MNIALWMFTRTYLHECSSCRLVATGISSTNAIKQASIHASRTLCPVFCQHSQSYSTSSRICATGTGASNGKPQIQEVLVSEHNVDLFYATYGSGPHNVLFIPGALGTVLVCLWYTVLFIHTFPLKYRVCTYKCLWTGSNAVLPLLSLWVPCKLYSTVHCVQAAARPTSLCSWAPTVPSRRALRPSATSSGVWTRAATARVARPNATSPSTSTIATPRTSLPQCWCAALHCTASIYSSIASCIAFVCLLSARLQQQHG